MDFIERFFGFSPDGGDGSTELLWLGALAFVVAMAVYFRIQRQKVRRMSADPGRRR
jgi:hypothetical protein